MGEAHARRGLSAVLLTEGAYAPALVEAMASQEAYRSCIGALEQTNDVESTGYKLQAVEAREGLASVLMLSSEVLSKLRRDADAEAAMENYKASLEQAHQEAQT
mgnify:CR=1 FL=1